MSKPNTWIHLCGNKIRVVPWNDLCPECKINSEVASLRYAGFAPTLEPTKKNWLSRLFLKKQSVTKRKPRPYEFEDDYNDRHG